ncbi:MAG: hypothetical protein [Caudoviricetes sp.]|nr:MAG: hypothetical protein [Caudoviricetes sp.]
MIPISQMPNGASVGDDESSVVQNESMVSISQLPDAGASIGDEVSPIVQDGTTVKGRIVLIDPNKDIVLPEQSKLKQKLGDKTVSLLSVSSEEDVAVITIGDAETRVVVGDKELLADAPKDDKVYARKNAAWFELEEKTFSVNGIEAVDGDVTITNETVKAHIENKNEAGSYVSNAGKWTLLSSEIDPLLAEKAEKVHKHVVADITDIQEKFDAKAEKIHDHVVADITDIEPRFDAKAEKIHDHVVDDITDIEPRFEAKAEKVHKHVVADITDIEPLFEAKAEKVHNHQIGDITGLNNKLGTLADKVHTHVIADVEELETQLSEIKASIVTHYGRIGGQFDSSESSGTVTATDHTESGVEFLDNQLVIKRDGPYMFNFMGSGTGTGVVKMQIDGVDKMNISSDLTGTFAINDIIVCTENQKIKLVFESTAPVTLKFGLTINSL